MEPNTLLKPGDVFGAYRIDEPFWDQDGCDFVDGLDPQGFGQHDRRDLIHAPAIWAFDHA